MKREQVLALYDTYADSVYRVALGYLRSPHDAEDAVQAVFWQADGAETERLSRSGAGIFDKADGKLL